MTFSGIYMASRIIGNMSGLAARLGQLGDRAVAGGSRLIESEAKIMHQLAVSYAPVDEGNLEDAIMIDTTSKGASGLGFTARTKFASIWVDVDRAYGQTKGGKIRRIGDYAIWIHEGTYNLGEKSLAKRMAGNDVGRKYMERAFLKRRRALVEDFNELMRRLAA